MPNVGLIGIGFMGKMHFGVHKASKRSKLVAIADSDPAKLAGDWSKIGGNIADGTAAKVDLKGIKTYSKLEDFLKDDKVEVVDICLPTFLHKEAVLKSLAAGKHVLCEKPMALNSSECAEIVKAAKKAKGKFMVAHCIRFWPEYEAIQEILADKRYGKIRSVVATRRGGTPTWTWGNWILQAEKSGAAVLDLHIHDVDFLLSLFGKPRSIFARGAGGATKGIDHVIGQFVYDDIGLVSAEGCWLGQPGYPFGMTLQVFLEKGTIVLDSSAKPSLRVYTPDGKFVEPPIPSGDGYSREVDYFLSCVDDGKPVSRVTPESAALAVQVVEAELESIRTGKPVTLDS